MFAEQCLLKKTKDTNLKFYVKDFYVFIKLSVFFIILNYLQFKKWIKNSLIKILSKLFKSFGCLNSFLCDSACHVSAKLMHGDCVSFKACN